MMVQNNIDAVGRPSEMEQILGPILKGLGYWSRSVYVGEYCRSTSYGYIVIIICGSRVIVRSNGEVFYIEYNQPDFVQRLEYAAISGNLNGYGI